jgi:bifunctional DNA-binding transcriptional regulator/antitoxin component of YhaV-PrlF toxin-antitoxin module
MKILRFIFEDKEMRGDRFDDLKCSKSGAIWVEIKDIQASDSYKKAREQSDTVLGVKSYISNIGVIASNIRIDSRGRILLPNSTRRKITEETNVEFIELTDGKFVILLSPKIEITARQQYNFDDLLKEFPTRDPNES